MSSQVMKIQLNPIAFFASELPAGPAGVSELGEAERLSAFFRDLARGDSLPQVEARVYESRPGTLLNAVPAASKVVERIKEPILSARVSYCLGRYYACVVMSGVACEMTSVLFEELLAIESIWGYEKRLKKLAGQPGVPPEFIEHAEIVRLLRNKYVHHLNADISSAKEDALNAYQSALKAIDSVFGLHPSDTVPGAIGLTDGPVKDFIEREGLILSKEPG